MTLQLNEVQQQAATHLNGAVLVTAGAGSGKTALLTQRITNLIASGVDPYHILCITFTNKAAAEMRSRLQTDTNVSAMWVMTFHGFCLRLLRMYGDGFDGYTKNFVIYAEAEKERVLKKIIADLQINDEKVLKKARSYISSVKNGMEPCLTFDEDVMIKVMDAYTREMRRCDAMDFDDLLIECYEMLRQNSDVLDKVRERFQYVSVDEFQDTNRIQYEIIKLIGEVHKNVFVVGDEDQSIYGWRGADIHNIFDFKKDFNATVYKLERNYRSTGNILSVANAIIAHNTQRLDKKLWTEAGKGAKVEKYNARDEGDEAEFVVRCIHSLRQIHDYHYSDIAILMRVNALTRVFEDRLLSYNIPYAVYGGLRFYDRKEIKDILAYLRTVVNVRDEEAVIRTINTPKRGIGESSVAQLRQYALDKGMTLNDCCCKIADQHELAVGLIRKISPYGTLLQTLRQKAEDYGVLVPSETTENRLADFVKLVIDESGYAIALAADQSEDGISRLRNVQELVSAVRDFVKCNPEASLTDYLENVALVSDTDNMDRANDVITLATVHSAKGLEFPAVFVVGLDEGIFPLKRDDAADMEEERRLMYVAVTRAKERLFLSRAASRYLYGKRESMAPSRFLCEDGSKQALAAASMRFPAPDRHALPTTPTYQPAKPNTGATVNPNDYPVGTVVLHGVFGQGTVKELTKMKDLTIVTVHFDTVGNKNLGLGLVELKIVK